MHKAALDSLVVTRGIAKVILSSTARSYLLGRLAPSIARLGEVNRALRYAEETELEWRGAAYMGIAEVTNGDVRKRALLKGLAAILELGDADQLDSITHALAGDVAVAAAAWPIAVEWGRAHLRHEAIKIFAAFAPVAQAIGRSLLPDEIYMSIEQCYVGGLETL